MKLSVLLFLLFALMTAFNSYANQPAFFTFWDYAPDACLNNYFERTGESVVIYLPEGGKTHFPPSENPDDWYSVGVTWNSTPSSESIRMTIETYIPSLHAMYLGSTLVIYPAANKEFVETGTLPSFTKDLKVPVQFGRNLYVPPGLVDPIEAEALLETLDRTKSPAAALAAAASDHLAILIKPDFQGNKRIYIRKPNAVATSDDAPEINYYLQLERIAGPDSIREAGKLYRSGDKKDAINELDKALSSESNSSNKAELLLAKATVLGPSRPEFDVLCKEAIASGLDEKLLSKLYHDMKDWHQSLQHAQGPNDYWAWMSLESSHRVSAEDAENILRPAMVFVSLKPGEFNGYAESATVALVRGELGPDSRGSLKGFPSPDKVIWTRNYLLLLAEKLPALMRDDYQKQIEEGFRASNPTLFPTN